MTEFYVGQIITGGWNFAPSGTALCNGQLIAISQNQALFAVIGTTYGGNGTTTFGLPNLQGRRMNHWGQGPGLSNYVIGQQAGTENASVLVSNLPAHTHALTGALNASGLQPDATTEAPSAGSVLGHAVDVSGNTPKAKPAIYCPTGTTANIALAGLNVSAGLTGNNIPMGIRNPFLAITMVMVLFGIFPTRN